MTVDARVACLSAVDIRVERRGQILVDHVSLEVAPGEMVAICGPSGSGKTTLLSVLAGLIRPDSGRVSLDGQPLRAPHDQTSNVGVVLQGYGLVPVLTAAENVEIVIQARGCSRSEVSEAAASALERVLLGGLGDRLVERLSGGQQQRVAVARSLARPPRLLLADEPTSELDETTRDHVIAEIRREARRGAIVVIATHDPDVVIACDRSVQLVGGRLVRG